MTYTDTIFAVSTLLGKSGVAMVRVSGPGCQELANVLGLPDPCVPNKLVRHELRAPGNTHDFIDDCMFVYFKAPKSFTGEDILEFHTHGSVAVVKRLLQELSHIKLSAGALRMAEPGEFARRAFLNGKMDLCQAEGLVALIDAETEMQRQVAARQMKGEQGLLYEGWRQRLLKILALLEALIDFPADEVPESTLKEVQAALHTFRTELNHHLSQGNNAEVIQRGVRIAIGGLPNAGKSTLLNQIAKREVAIVSEIAGTTRDVVEIKIDLDGFPVILSDTAGVRESDDIIEREGVRRAYKALHDADICLIVCDASEKLPYALLKHVAELQKPFHVIVNKIDTIDLTDARKHGILEQFKAAIPLGISYVSLRQQGSGLGDIISSLKTYVAELYTPSSEPLLTSERHRALLREALESLEQFDTHAPIDIASQHVRIAASCLGQITGKIEVEEVLDLIFSTFCIGK